MTNDNYQKFKSVNQIIINYVNSGFPEWNTHAGLGFKTDSFLMSTFLQNYSYFDDDDYSSAEALQLVYKNINSKYVKYKKDYQLEFNTYANDSFFNDYVICYGLENLDTLKLEKEYFSFINELKKEVVFIPENYTLETN